MEEARNTADLLDYLEIAEKSESNGDDREVPIRCPIYAFVKNLTKSNADTVYFWTISWHRQGFLPIILTEKDALSRPEYGNLMSRVPSSETSAGYMRWLAMASVQGGLYVDINIIPMLGHGALFKDYRENCRATGQIQVYDGHGFRIFQANAAEIHAFVKRLSGERSLKGPDESWLTVNRHSYRIGKSDEKLAIIDTLDNAYVQRHRRFSHHPQFNPESLRKALAQSNFKNTHRIHFLKTEDSTFESAIEGSLRRSLECPSTTQIGYDLANVMPNHPFLCAVDLVSTLEEFKRASEGDAQGIADLYLVLVEDPAKHAIRSEGKPSQLLSRLHPGYDGTDIRPHVKKILGSPQFILVLIDEDYAKVKWYLEFRFGFPLDVVPDFATPEPGTAANNTLARQEDLLIYSMIKEHYLAELSSYLEFS